VAQFWCQRRRLVNLDYLNCLAHVTRVVQSRKLLAKFGQRVRGAAGKDRTDLLLAAHAVVAVNAYFETFRDVELPIELVSLELTAAEKLALAGTPEFDASCKLADAVLRLPVHVPAPSRPYERVVRDIKFWYLQMSQRTLKFLNGLAVWDNLDDTKQAILRGQLIDTLPELAVRRYEEGRADPEPGREAGERLAFAQAGQDQEGLLLRVQLPPQRAERDPVAADDPGREVQGLTRQRQRGTAGKHGSPW
jgi:hypothetical protein